MRTLIAQYKSLFVFDVRIFGIKVVTFALVGKKAVKWKKSFV